ncbi:MAG: UvrABC system protein C [Syntrophus sp. SKADARSKE-3]|nr:UvrABC system protein C [Syntrophus sp. SKADARSKE-3]
MDMNTQDDPISLKVQNAPRQPGIYMMKDTAGEILYVGKAKDLRARIRAYFGGTDSRFMVPFLVNRVHDVDFIVTATEKEALILENNLIKEHRPRYNVDFRDDKAYFNIRLDPGIPFPRFQLVRRTRKDGARYFGPYPSSGAAKETLNFLQSVFPLRTCRDGELQGRKRPCLEHEIGRCAAPCVDAIDKDAYGRIVRESLAFLEGKANTLVTDLEDRMTHTAAEERFEEAAVLRDRLMAIRATLEKQRIVSMSHKNQDIFGIYREGQLTQVCCLFIRLGKMVGQRSFPLIKLGMDVGEILSSLMKQFYADAVDIPAEIIVPVDHEDRTVLAEWLTELRGRAVEIIIPQRGQSMDLVRLAESNAQNTFNALRAASGDIEDTLKRLKSTLSLKNTPERIECFDISNIGGQFAVGSMVTFLSGKPCKEAYRRFRIRTIEGADDFGMMYAVLRRRLKREDLPLPDLLMVDGGKGQLSVAISAMKDEGISGVDVVGLAKAADEGDANSRFNKPVRKKPSIPRGEDRVYLPGRKDPIYLSRWPAAFFLLQRVRDEAHRFAVSYHRKLKEKEDLQSVLDLITGVGATRKKALLAYFGDMKRIRAATVADLQQVDGVGKDTAEAIYSFLKGETS